MASAITTILVPVNRQNCTYLTAFPLLFVRDVPVEYQISWQTKTRHFIVKVAPFDHDGMDMRGRNIWINPWRKSSDFMQWIFFKSYIFEISALSKER